MAAAAVEVVDRLLEYVQNVYITVDEEQYHLFNKEIEEEKKEYEKWEDEFKHSTITPLGLKKGDFIIRDIGTMEVDLESEEEEEEEDNEEVDDYYEDDLTDEPSSHLSL